MKWLPSLILLASASVFIAGGCADDGSSQAPDSLSELRGEGKAEPSSPFTPTPSHPPAIGKSDAESRAECQVGLVLRPSDQCTYPDTSEQFWVDESGVGHFLFLSANSVIDARNAIINNQPYEFTARKRDDGNWTIEVAGSPADSIRLSDLRVTATATAFPFPANTSEPATSPKPSPTPMRVFPIRSAAPTVTPDRLHFPSPTAAVAPTATATPRALAQYGRATLSTTHFPLSTPDSIEPLSTASPDSAVSYAATAPQETVPEPEVASIAVSVAPLSDQVVRIHETTVVSLVEAFPEVADDGARRFRAIVANPAVGQASVNAQSGELTLSGLKSGATWVALQACNAEGCSKLGERNIRLTVLPAPNRPPQAVESITDQHVHVGDSFSFSVASAFWDFEGDPIVDYQIELADDDLASVVAITSDGLLTLSGEQVGETSVSVSACDNEACGSGGLALRFDLNVLAQRNLPPVVTGSIADQTLHIGETIRLDLSTLFEDPEGDPVRDYTFERQDRGVVVGEIYPEEAMLFIRGAEVGSTVASIYASDGGSGMSSAGLPFNLTVTEPQRSPPRVVGVVSDQTVALGDSIDVSLSHAFLTPSRFRVIRYDVLLKEPEVGLDSRIDRAGILTLEGTVQGRTWVSVRACSYAGCSNFSDLSFVLTVSDPDGEQNSSPEPIGAFQDRTMMVGETATLDISKAFRDPDQDEIVDYSYSLSRSGCAAGSITNTGILTLRGSDVCETTVSVTACDDAEECSEPSEMSFTLTVGRPVDKE